MFHFFVGVCISGYISIKGPYDELLIVPGNFSLPFQKPNQKPQTAARISRIYVSTLHSVLNGKSFLFD